MTGNADPEVQKLLAWLDTCGGRALDPNMPQLCRYGTPFPDLKTQPCDCAVGACRLHRKPTAGMRKDGND